MQLNLTYDGSHDSWSTRLNGNLMVLSRKADASTLKPNTKYMIVSRLGKHAKGWIVEPVNDDLHKLVDHDGFECSGSMCSTMAYVPSIRKMLTPGRVMHIVTVTDNVNARWPYPVWDQAELDRIKAGDEFKPENLRMNEDYGKDSKVLCWYMNGIRKLHPGQVYVERAELESWGNKPLRACGLPSLESIGRGVP